VDTTPDRKNSSAMLYLSLGASLGLILLTAFQWSLAEWLAMPLILPVAWLFFVVMGVLTIQKIDHSERQGRSAAYPFVVWVLAAVVMLVVPFTQWTLELDYHLHKTARVAVIARLLDGSLKPDSDSADYSTSLRLGRDMPTVSKGGNVIEVQKHEGDGYYVFFYTFLGLLDNYSGFLYVPDGADPRQFWDFTDPSEAWLVQYDENWYWVSHR